MSRLDDMAEKKACELAEKCRKLQDELETVKKELEKEREEHRISRKKLACYASECEAFRFCISHIFGDARG